MDKKVPEILHIKSESVDQIITRLRNSSLNWQQCEMITEMLTSSLIIPDVDGEKGGEDE